MNAYALTLSPADLAWAKKEALRAGCKLLPDDEEGGFMLIGERLPPTLAGFEKKAKGAEGAKKTPSATRAVKPAEADGAYQAIDVPFEARSIASKLGARWDEQSKCWFYKGELPELLRPMRSQRFSWERAMQNAKNGLAPRPFGPQGEPFTPRPHQSEAGKMIERAKERGLPGFLLADEVGLGKTISAWLGAQRVARLTKAQSVLVVCPLSVMAHWRETISRMGSLAPDVLIINYDRLGKLFEMPEGAKAKSKKGLARKGQAPEAGIVIFDEAHKLKNPAAARSKLAAKIAQKAGFTLYLSATAGQSPLELSYLADLIAKATGQSARSLKDFELWCVNQGFGVSRGGFGQWKWSGDRRDCERLREMLYEGERPVGLRRRPQQIAGWPEISRQLMPQTLDAAEQALYQASWEEFKRALKEGAPAAAKGGKPGAGKGVSGLVEALRFRQKSSELRVERTAQMALDLFEEGVKPAISCAFKQSASEIKKKLEAAGLRVSLIWGAMGADERESQRLDFQTGRSDAVVFTVEEGISLHQGQHEDVPRALLIHDLRWSAIQMSQIEGRCHRDGKFAQAYWLAGEGTVEMRIAARVAKRAEAMKTLSGDEDSGIEQEILEELKSWADPI